MNEKEKQAILNDALATIEHIDFANDMLKAIYLTPADTVTYEQWDAIRAACPSISLLLEKYRLQCRVAAQLIDNDDLVNHLSAVPIELPD